MTSRTAILRSSRELRPLVRTIPSYIKDTTDFLMKVQSLTNLPSNALLVTLDVSSLYTNIPHEEGIAACTEALNTRETQSPPTADLAELISEILNKNAFVFGEQHYLQVYSTAMGTRMAPSYANLFMLNLKEIKASGQCQHEAPHLVEVHRRHLCHLVPW